MLLGTPQREEAVLLANMGGTPLDGKPKYALRLNPLAAIDILVNSAGMAGLVGPLQANDVAAWIRTIQVNLIGTYACCRAVQHIMSSDAFTLRRVDLL